MGEYTPRVAYELHKNGAKRRGIVFKFSFRSWAAWWRQHLGPDWFKKRGPRRHQFVMARHKDKGPYEIKNVKCITASQNCRESYIYGLSVIQKRKAASWAKLMASLRTEWR